MSDATSATSNTTSAAAAASPGKSRLWRLLQFSLLSMLLLTVAIAVWLAYRRTVQEIAQMRLELPGLREVARELIVADPEQYTVVQHHPNWMGDYRWRIYLPPGRQYKLALATRNIKFAPRSSPSIPVTLDAAEKTCEIGPGEHELELQRSRNEEQLWQVRVLVDGELVFEQTQPKNWTSASPPDDYGSRGYYFSEQQDIEEPFIIYHSMAPNRTGPPGPSGFPTDGILLWIDAEQP